MNGHDAESESRKYGELSLESRIRAVEGDMRELKTEMKHMATKAWILGGILGGMGVAAGIAILLVRFLLVSPWLNTALISTPAYFAA